MSLLIALAACTTVDHTELVSATTDLAKIDGDCSYNHEDLDLEDAFVVSRVTRDGDLCRANVYAKTTLVDWADVESEISGPSPLGAIRVAWTGVSGTFTRLAVETVSGGEAPAETAVAVDQLVSSASANQPTFDDNPEALMDALANDALAGYPEHLLGFRYLLEGGEDDLVDLVDVAEDDPAPLVDDSWNSDPELFLLTVASVSVPLATLDALGPTELSLAVEESVRFEADLHYKLFGSEQ